MEPREDPYNAPIEELCLTVRCYSALKRDGIDTVGQLAMLLERHLMGLRNFTPRTMDELKGRLEELGLFQWDAPQSTGNQGGSGAAGQAPGPGRPGRLSLGALSAAGALLPQMNGTAGWRSGMVNYTHSDPGRPGPGLSCRCCSLAGGSSP
jgi:hypothetical protein